MTLLDEVGRGTRGGRRFKVDELKAFSRDLLNRVVPVPPRGFGIVTLVDRERSEVEVMSFDEYERRFG